MYACGTKRGSSVGSMGGNACLAILCEILKFSRISKFWPKNLFSKKIKFSRIFIYFSIYGWGHLWLSEVKWMSRFAFRWSSRVTGALERRSQGRSGIFPSQQSKDQTTSSRMLRYSPFVFCIYISNYRRSHSNAEFQSLP